MPHNAPDRAIVTSTARRKSLRLSTAVGLLFSMMTFVGLSFSPHESKPYLAFLASLVGDVLSAAIVAALYFAMVFAVTFALTTRFPSWLMKAGDDGKPTHALQLDLRPRSIATATAIALICWSPWLVLQYPTGMNGDTYNQLTQFFASAPTYYTTKGTYLPGEFIDHHPVFDTLVFGGFYSIGFAIGNENAGLFAYAVTQYICTAIALVVSVCYLQKLFATFGVSDHASYRLRVALFAFVCVWPAYPQWAPTMIKDPLFCVFFIGYMVCIVELFRTKGEAAEGKPFLVAFIAISVLCALTKKTGIILVIITSVVLLIAYRKHLKSLVAVPIAVLLVCELLIPFLLYPAIGGVSPGGRQESLYPMLQQVVTVLKEHGQDVSDEELASIEKVLDIDKALKGYKSDIVDPVKNQFRDDATTEDIVEFAKTWAKIGIRHPLTYIRATCLCTGSNLVPGQKPMSYYSTFQVPEKKVASAEEAGIVFSFHQPEAIAELSSAVKEATGSFVEATPVVDVVMSKGFPFAFMLLMSILILSNGRKFAIPLVPVFISMLIVIISPTNSARYVLPLIDCFVPVFGLLCVALAGRDSMRPRSSSKQPINGR